VRPRDELAGALLARRQQYRAQLADALSVPVDEPTQATAAAMALGRLRLGW
jgi:hypothetical protein